MLRLIEHKAEWQANHFLQSWEWGEFQSAYSRVLRFADGDARASVEVRSLPLGFHCWFVPRGPQGFSREQYAELAALARESGAVFVRFEPAEVPPVGRVAASLNPAVTLLTDLSQSEEQLLSGMHQKTRYNLRLAEKKGVVVSESKDTDVWLKLHHQTTARDRFKGHADDYYCAMLACPITRLYVASFEGEPLAAMIAVFYGDTVTYLHGASSNAARDVMAPYLLHWSVMREGKSLGCARYDWWGINPTDAQHPAYKRSWEGITRFKRGFGGEEVHLPGTFELATRPVWYKLYEWKRSMF